MYHKLSSQRSIKLILALFMAAVFILSSCPDSHAMSYLSTPKYYNLTFTDMNGKTHDIHKFKKNSTLLIFGRSGCSISRDMLDTASRLKKNGAKTNIVFFGVDNYDSGLYSLKSKYSNVMFVRASSTNNNTMWNMLRRCGCTYRSITLPAMFLLNKYGHIKCYSTGRDYGLNYRLQSTDFKEKIKLDKYNCSVYFNNYKIRERDNSVIYKGKAVRPKVNVYLSGSNGYASLEKGKDYTVSYVNNNKTGTAKVIIKGKGGLKGKRTLKFKIYGKKAKKNSEFKDYYNKYVITKGGESGKINAKVVGPKKRSAVDINITDSVYFEAKKCKITSIDKNAFLNCTSAQEVYYIGRNIEKIGSGAFQGCSNLRSIRINSKKITKIGKNAFLGVPEDVKVSIAGSEAYRQRVLNMMKAAGLPSNVTASYFGY